MYNDLLLYYNLIIYFVMCYVNASASNGIPFVRVAVQSSNIAAFVSANSDVCSNTTGALSNRRPNTRFHHCSLVHKAMSDKLTRIVADPAISAEETNRALRTTRCPCCDTQINASYPAIHRENGEIYV